MIGAFAFAISLVRDRLYAQDYSDIEYAAASLTAPSVDGAPVPHRLSLKGTAGRPALPLASPPLAHCEVF